MSESRTIAFRTDASLAIGSGHVMRCLTLAEALKAQGAECQFLCREHPGHLIDLIEARGFRVHRLAASAWPASDSIRSQTPNAKPCHTDPPHAHWLGASWAQDAEACQSLLAALAPDWLVVDHYALDARWEHEVARVVGRIMVVDDLSDRDHQADILLDQNVLNHEGEDRYRVRVNSECKLLLGPNYALLGQEYTFLAQALPERDGHVSRILIFVGGSDPHHLTEQYLKALSAPEFQQLQVDVVIGKNHPNPDSVAEIVSQRDTTRLYSGLPSLAALMVRADLMLGAGGTTNWERMCLGLNSIVVSVARNQDEINRELADQALIHFLGKAESISVDNIQATVRFVLDNSSYNCTQSKAIRKVVDGCGTKRVAQLLMEEANYAIA